MKGKYEHSAKSQQEFTQMNNDLLKWYKNGEIEAKGKYENFTELLADYSERKEFNYLPAAVRRIYSVKPHRTEAIVRDYFDKIFPGRPFTKTTFVTGTQFVVPEDHMLELKYYTKALESMDDYVQPAYVIERFWDHMFKMKE